MAFDRLVYSPLVERPRLRWPGGARLAVWIVPNIEHYEYLPDVRVRDPWPRVPHPDVMGFGSRDYGNRVGFWRLLDVMDRYSVPCTVSLNAAAYVHYPEIRDACLSRRWDHMAHGVYNTRYHWNLDEDEERAAIAECLDLCRQVTGSTPAGWLSPANTNTWRTPDLIAEAGIRYYCDIPHDEQPFPIKVRSGRLITMPYQLDVNDGLSFRHNIEAEDFADSVIALFDALYEDGAATGRVMCFAPHPYILGQPHRVRALDRIIRHIVRREDVWVATGSEIADWYIANYLPQLEARLVEGVSS